MNLSTSIDWTELSIQWMLTCGHFLWQGFAVAILFSAVERLAAMLRRPIRSDASEALQSRSTSPVDIDTRSSASTRYALSCAAFLALPACVLLTFALVHSRRGSILRATSPTIESTVSMNGSLKASASSIDRHSPIQYSGDGPGLGVNNTVASDQAMQPDPVTREGTSFSQRARFLAPILSVAYAIVVGLLLFRLAWSLFGSHRMRKLAQPVTDPQLLQAVVTHANRLKLKAVPLVALCVRVSSPVVVGIVRPMILLPPSLLCGLDPTQLAAILSHEMAHIRRYDPLFNLLQRVVESLLFFHPITWWLSRRVAIERENCCDDVAASFVGRVTYAEALLKMASLCLANHRGRHQALAMLAADGGSASNFGYRIRRLLNAQESPRIRVTKGRIAIGLLTIGCMWGSLVALAQSPPARNEPPMNQPGKDALVDGIQWSTWGDVDGLVSGARLILPDGGVKPGQPVVVEYRLKNVSQETKTLLCYVRGNRTHVTLGSNQRISDMGIDMPDEAIQITLAPGNEYVATASRTSIDTRGLSPGVYQVALGSAFFYPDAVNPGAKHEIPHRGSIPLTILGESVATIEPALDKGIHWGNAISGLRLGAQFHNRSNVFSIGDIVEADLWIANVTNQAIECSIRLPHPMDGWLFNVENHLGETIMLERLPMISSPLPQAFYSLKLAPGENRLITGDRIEGQPDKFAGPRAKFEIIASEENRPRRPNAAALLWSDHTIKGRLVTQGGDYSAIFNVMLDRPDVPGIRIELDTGNYPFMVVGANTDPNAARVLDEATDRSILWGESSSGLRLGIRQSEFARHRSAFRHGEHIDYEVWIKNETDEVVQFARDPRDVQSPRLMDNRSINVIGGGIWMSFMIPPEELAKAELVLPPGHAARRFLSYQHSASIRAPGSPRGRYGSDPLLLEPGKYTVYAQDGELKSGVEEVEIIPAARLQIRKSSRVTDKSRESAAEDPSDAILSWQLGNGEKQEALINWDHGVLVDERDMASAQIVPVDGHPDQYSMVLQLRPESATWLSDRIRSYSLWDNPDMVAILFDDKPLGAVRISSPIPDGKLIIPTGIPLEQAQGLREAIQAAISLP